MSHRRLHLLPIGLKEEKILLAELRAGSAEAFEMLYQRHIDKVLGITRQLLRDGAAAEDAAQETFLRVFRSVHRFRGDSSLARWIHRIATNVCINELERRKRRRKLAQQKEETSLADAPTRAPRPRGELQVSLSEILDRLSPRKRVSFYLAHVEGWSAAEIAETTGDSRAAVIKRLQRTRAQLLEMWDDAEAGAARDDRAGGDRP